MARWEAFGIMVLTPETGYRAVIVRSRLKKDVIATWHPIATETAAFVALHSKIPIRLVDDPNEYGKPIEIRDEKHRNWIQKPPHDC